MYCQPCVRDLVYRDVWYSTQPPHGGSLIPSTLPSHREPVVPSTHISQPAWDPIRTADPQGTWDHILTVLSLWAWNFIHTFIPRGPGILSTQPSHRGLGSYPHRYPTEVLGSQPWCFRPRSDIHSAKVMASAIFFSLYSMNLLQRSSHL